MKWFSKSSGKEPFHWISLTSEAAFLSLLEDGETVVIFKHSTRCSISSMAMHRVERAVSSGGDVKYYYLDVLRYREVSNLVEEALKIRHQSPQLIILKDGVVTRHASHNAITAELVQAA